MKYDVMTDNQTNNNRLAQNTVILYIRLILTLVIGLYTSRVVLNALGVEDFGIYNVVGGIVSMFTMISGSLSAAITRFLTFELGKNDIESVRRTFATSMIIQIALCVIIILFAESVGLWFLHSKMIIPADRMVAANWVYQFSLITFCLNLINIPYNAVVIAHERMNIYAYMSIYDAIAKLVVVYLLIISPIDRLIFYAFLLTLVSLSSRLIYGVYCSNHFEECNTKLIFNKPLFKEMFSFSYWNFIGVISSVFRDSGGNVIINMFYPPTVNAARGVAIQVGNAVRSFSSNFVVAINPQITKTFAANEREYTNKLVISGAKLSYFLLFVLALPVLCNTHYLLEIWLKIVPEYAVVFVRLVLILALVDSISETMITLMLATGDIKTYQIVVGCVVLLNLPISYLFLKLGYLPQIVVIVAILISLICIMLRAIMLKRMVGFPISYFVKDVLLKILIVTALTGTAAYYFTSLLDESFFTLIVSSVFCVLSSFTIIWLFGFNRSEKTLVINLLSSKIKFLK